MKAELIALEDSRHWNPLMSAYIAKDERLSELYSVYPSKSNLLKQLPGRGLAQEIREDLVEVLTEQYKTADLLTDYRAKLIEKLLNPNSRTVTSGHQLGLFGGPAYFVYKIAGLIKLAQELDVIETPVLPIFWMATEDHDFEEINHFYLGEDRIEWKREGAGACGRMSFEGIEQVQNDLRKALGNRPDSDRLLGLFESTYLKSKNLSEATLKLVHAIFEGQDLLCLDADSKVLKAHFVPYMKQELLAQVAEPLVNEKSAVLKGLGYKAQVFPREINLFFLTDDGRYRIEKRGEDYGLVDADQTWTEEELLKKLEENPQSFSPNALLRPLYQEVILPNVAYLGGGGELSYWFQLKAVFDHFQVPFPALFPRNSGLALGENVLRKMKQLEIDPVQLFKGVEVHLEKILESNESYDGFLAEKEKFGQLSVVLKQRFSQFEESMHAYSEAHVRKMEKVLEHMESKFKRRMKKKEEIRIQKLEAIYREVYPKKVLQERIQSFAYLRLALGAGIIPKLIDNFDPFAFNVLILKDQSS